MFLSYVKKKVHENDEAREMAHTKVRDCYFDSRDLYRTVLCFLTYTLSSLQLNRCLFIRLVVSVKCNTHRPAHQLRCTNRVACVIVVFKSDIDFWHWMFQGEFGEILLSLSYNSAASKLTVLILKCRDLMAQDLNGYSGTSTTRPVT